MRFLTRHPNGQKSLGEEAVWAGVCYSIRGQGVGRLPDLSLAPPAGEKLAARKQKCFFGYPPTIAALKPGHLRQENSLAKARIWRDKEHPVICKVSTVGLRGPFLKGSLPLLHCNEASERPSVRIGQRMRRTRDLGHFLWASAAFILPPSRPSLGFPRVREPFCGRGNIRKKQMTAVGSAGLPALEPHSMSTMRQV